MGAEEFDPELDPMSTAWLAWCDTLKRVPELVKQLGRENEPRIQAQGFRYFARLANMAMERGFEGADRDYPRLLYCQGPARKIGGDCPDAIYRDCAIDDEGRYRISGNRGNAEILMFTLNKNPLVAAREKTGSIAAHIPGGDLDCDADGNFELWLGGPSRTTNWVALPKDTDRLIVRQFFGAKREPDPAQLSIERLDPPQTPATWTPADVSRALGAAQGFLNHIPTFWSGELERLYEQPNRLATLAPEHQARVQALPGGTPLWGSFLLEEDEALLVEFRPPACDYWSLLTGGHWFESLDYRTQNCHLNMDQAEISEGGVVRVVVSHQDPGILNWVQTGGNRQGFLLLRYISNDPKALSRSNMPEEPTCRIISFARLANELPSFNLSVSPAERIQDQRRRRQTSDHRVEGI